MWIIQVREKKMKLKEELTEQEKILNRKIFSSCNIHSRTKECMACRCKTWTDKIIAYGYNPLELRFCSACSILYVNKDFISLIHKILKLKELKS